jgi:catechol 2,3-dioxygenase-like lactoylglutathione lyase family enzyme
MGVPAGSKRPFRLVVNTTQRAGFATERRGRWPFRQFPEVPARFRPSLQGGEAVPHWTEPAGKAGGPEEQIEKETKMLAHCPLTTILPVIDLERARDFYENKLGLAPGQLNADGKFVYRCGGGALLALFPKPGGTKAEHTAISFQVRDVGATITALKARGVVFEDYDFPGLKTVGHVCVLGAEKAAWFKDSEGNLLCLHEDLS